MEFPDPLIRGTLVKRYKRFFADVELPDGKTVVAHCANTGAMTGLKEPGLEVWLSPARNPKRKLRYSWELVRIGDGLVGVNTALPNHLVAEAIEAGKIAELHGYRSHRREVKYGKNSRIDLLLEDHEDDAPVCYVEVKNVHLKRAGGAEFPDAVTARGKKHLLELAEMVAQGHRAVMFYLVQREDCATFSIAGDVDPDYEKTLKIASSQGVETICYACRLTPQAVTVDRPLPMRLTGS